MSLAWGLDPSNQHPEVAPPPPWAGMSDKVRPVRKDESTVSTKSPTLPRPPGQLGATSAFTLLGGLCGTGLSNRSLLGLAGPEPLCWAQDSVEGSGLGLAGAGPLSWVGASSLGSSLGAGGRGRGGSALSSTWGPSQAGISRPRCFMSLVMTSST